VLIIECSKSNENYFDTSSYIANVIFYFITFYSSVIETLWSLKSKWNIGNSEMPFHLYYIFFEKSLIWLFFFDVNVNKLFIFPKTIFNLYKITFPREKQYQYYIFNIFLFASSVLLLISFNEHYLLISIT